MVTGTADRVALVTNKNKVMFTLEDSATVYTVDTNDFAQANLMRPGDKLKFKALIVREQSIGNVAEFKNESLK